MNRGYRMLWAAITALVFDPAIAVGQDEFGFEDTSAPLAQPVPGNHVEIGVGQTEDADGKFGEYTSGLNSAYQRNGPFALGSFRFADANPESAVAWQVQGGSGTGRLLEAFYGVQGNFRLALYGDRLEKIEYGDARSPYQGGGNVLLLPEAYVPGASARDSAFYGKQDIATTRETLGFTGVKHLSERWTLSLDAEQQDKHGEDTLGGNQGFSGTALIPEPIDYNTDLVTARVDFADKRLQTGVAAHFSRFKNGNDTVTFENAQTDAGLQQIALEPENRFLRVAIDGGYSPGLRTRLSWFGNWSRAEQDERFLAVVDAPASLDGEVERKALKLALVGRPFARADYRLEYNYRDRRNQHAALLIDTSANHLYDRATQSGAIEGGYRFANRLRIRGGIEYTENDRDTRTVFESVTDRTDETRRWLELRLPAMGNFNLKLRTEHGTQDADLDPATQDFIFPGGEKQRATPFFLLGRTRDLHAIDVDYSLGASTVLYASWKLISDDFDNDSYGLQDRDSRVVDLGLSWTPVRAVAVSAYASFEEYQLRQLGRQMGGTAVPFAEWLLRSQDQSDAYGITLDWAVVEDKLDIRADIAYLESDSSFTSRDELNAGLPILTGSLPDSDDELLRVDLRVDYRFNKRLEFSGRYLCESRSANDWGWDTRLDVDEPTTASTIGFAYRRPDYTAQALMLSARYSF